jgi:lysophospholipase L1-like esterase
VQSVPPAPPAIVTPAPLAPWIAEPRPWEAQRWQAQHRTFVARARRGGIDVLFLGDSIAELFPTVGYDVWRRRIAPLGAVAAFGIGGDQTQYVLWRARHGELDGSGARAVVLMIGTNNLGTAAPQDVARGIAAIVTTIRARLPNAVVVLNALLPRGRPGDSVRAKLAAVNARIAGLADGKHVRWLDAGSGFVDTSGRIAPALMPDLLHPSAEGYEIWAAALRPVLLDALAKAR